MLHPGYDHKTDSTSTIPLSHIRDIATRTSVEAQGFSVPTPGGVPVAVPQPQEQAWQMPVGAGYTS